MHYRQLMTLDIGNDALLCKVFPASLQGQALSWFHRLPPNSVDNFRDLSEAFVGQYLCSARHKQNISTLFILSGPPQGKANDVSASPIQGRANDAGRA
ncbi:hypothetical protein CK203_101694 [Vitis vinifera]|uniref:Retrotransposon gag domain-containing protein n=1 Tax=Vitis vinifera TaxID=29760 RepID=A0A438FHT9_VITVI|nr:hypothetical protein CK203_101694 [Vitis vinifera]